MSNSSASASRRDRRRARLAFARAERRATAAEIAVHDLASERDAAWFREHPGRNNRIRPPLYGEARLDPDRLTLIFVRQVRPGVRFRFSFHYLGPRIPEGECPEESAVWIFRDLMQRAPRMAAWFDAMQDVTASAPVETGGGE